MEALPEDMKMFVDGKQTEDEKRKRIQHEETEKNYENELNVNLDDDRTLDFTKMETFSSFEQLQELEN